MSNKTFEERNLNSYIKYSDVSLEIMNKYKNVLPEYLIKIWETMGFGIYEINYLN
ncbi:GAD-like domain-containing protein [Empedobacter tilapiae]|uniref:GAD-like domain-containing protein n=1 Tax=Empedobacter tilapiae TaxID=2491114 RepID=UPI001FEA24CA|nr:GAD-like domain-containing protein [Empedobacter tilapiae]